MQVASLNGEKCFLYQWHSPGLLFQYESLYPDRYLSQDMYIVIKDPGSNT